MAVVYDGGRSGWSSFGTGVVWSYFGIAIVYNGGRSGWSSFGTVVVWSYFGMAVVYDGGRSGWSSFGTVVGPVLIVCIPDRNIFMVGPSYRIIPVDRPMTLLLPVVLNIHSCYCIYK